MLELCVEECVRDIETTIAAEFQSVLPVLVDSSNAKMTRASRPRVLINIDSGIKVI